MELKIDTHTHTTMSGHAFSTLLENVEFAAKHGLEGLVVSEHGPAVPGAQPGYSAGILRTLPEQHLGVRIYRGGEANILNAGGKIDIKEKYLKMMDLVIASLHETSYESKDVDKATTAMINALDNPYVDIIGHPGNPFFPVDFEAVAKHAKKRGKMLEVNNHSFVVREGSSVTCKTVIRLCKEYSVPILVSSDAHVCFNVGVFDSAKAILEEQRFPEELIYSRNRAAFEGYLAQKAQRLKSMGLSWK